MELQDDFETEKLAVRAIDTIKVVNHKKTTTCPAIWFI